MIVIKVIEVINGIEGVLVESKKRHNGENSTKPA